MKVAVYPAGGIACEWYRLRWPAKALQVQGADVVVREHLEVVGVPDGSATTFITARDPEADVVVLQRPLDAVWLACMRDLQHRGVRVVVEVDDDFVALPLSHPMRRADPRGENRAVLTAACREADMVTVSTPALARRYGAHGRVRVIRNRVPAWYLREARPPAPPPEKLVVGWAGPSSVHVEDLEVVGTAVAGVVRETGVRFRGIGDDDIPARFGVDATTAEVVGWQHLPSMAYARELARLDVGLVPLRMCAFNEGKSALKGLDMCATGVPFVASPTSEYLELHRQGAGLLASRPREWRRELLRLIRDDELREELRGRGRAIALEHTIERHAGEWWDAWEAALQSRAVA